MGLSIEEKFNQGRYVNFSEDFNSFKKIEIELPTDLIEEIENISKLEQNRKLGFDGVIVSLLWKAIES